jgi:hypothetical protein
MIFDRPDGPRGSEASNLAEQCKDRQFFVASAATWSAGFAADPMLAEGMKAKNRYKAACSAALAGTSKGIDMPPLDEQAKTRWRLQAMGWLKVDLAHWAKQAESRVPDVKGIARKTLQHGKTDRDLTGIRDEEEVTKLPEPERKEWQSFWADVAELLKNADRN